MDAEFLSFDAIGTSANGHSDVELSDDDDDDAAFDAHNEETFGSAAVTGDWEEDHMYFAFLTESERKQRSKKDEISPQLIKPPNDNLSDLWNSFSDISLNFSKNVMQHNYTSSPSSSKFPLFNSSSSSIWNNSIGLDSPSGSNGLAIEPLSPFPKQPDLRLSTGAIGQLSSSLPLVRTVEDLEQEILRKSEMPPRLGKYSGANVGTKDSNWSPIGNSRNLSGSMQGLLPLPTSIRPGLHHNIPRVAVDRHTQELMNDVQFGHLLGMRLPYNRWQSDNNSRFPTKGSSHEGPHLRSSTEREGGYGRIRRDSDYEWEEWHQKRLLDPYAGLMTPKEKAWLKNIQTLQLQNENPYWDDYYYVMYVAKQRQKEKNFKGDPVEIEGLQLLLPDRGKEGREYEPPHLENSLGKLQVASVNAPRKIIDIEPVQPSPLQVVTPLQKEMRRYRHLLLLLEKLYDMMIEIEDLERKSRLLPDCPTRDQFFAKIKRVASSVWSRATQSQETLVQLLCVRKGKILLAKVINHLSETERDRLLTTILQNMSLLSKKDATDQLLPLFWPAADQLLATAPAIRLINYANILTKPQASTGHSSSISSIILNKFGVSVVLALLTSGELLWPQLDNQPVWQQFLSEVVAALDRHDVCAPEQGAEEAGPPKSWIPLPLPSVLLSAAPVKPSSHLRRLEGSSASLLKSATDTLIVLEGALQKPPAPSLLFRVT